MKVLMFCGSQYFLYGTLFLYNYWEGGGVNLWVPFRIATFGLYSLKKSDIAPPQYRSDTTFCSPVK